MNTEDQVRTLTSLGTLGAGSGAKLRFGMDDAVEDDLLAADENSMPTSASLPRLLLLRLRLPPSGLADATLISSSRPKSSSSMESGPWPPSAPLEPPIAEDDDEEAEAGMGAADMGPGPPTLL